MQDNPLVLAQRWHLALENAAFGVWDLDPRAETVRYSPQWKARLGYPPDDDADPTAAWRARVHPDDLGPMLAALLPHLAALPAGLAETDYEHEFRLRGADGGWRWVLSRGRVVERDADGRATRMVGTLTDLTTRRTAPPAATREAQRELLARMSHELRTPLNAVLGFAQLLSRQLGDDDLLTQRRQLAQIEAAGWQLLGMIDASLGSTARAPAREGGAQSPAGPCLSASDVKASA